MTRIAGCHRHSNGSGSHASVWEGPGWRLMELLLSCFVVQTLILSMSPGRIGPSGAVPETLNLLRVERRIWWFTVSDATDGSRTVRAEDREFALAARGTSVTASRAVSVAWPALKTDWWGSRRLFCKG